MRTLYIANKNYSSWSLRPWVLLKQIGIPFEERLVPFDDLGTGAHFASFSPNKKVPCLHDGELRIWDSLAIVEYLAEQWPQVWPKDRGIRAWARSATAEMHSGYSALRTRCDMNCGVRIVPHQVDSKLQSDLDRVFEVWQRGLTTFGGPFLTGDAFCALDAFFSPVAFRFQTYRLTLPDHAKAYIQTLLGLESMQSWYQSALAETFRDRVHDDIALQFGTLEQDLRAQAPTHSSISRGNR